MFRWVQHFAVAEEPPNRRKLFVVDKQSEDISETGTRETEKNGFAVAITSLVSWFEQKGNIPLFALVSRIIMICVAILFNMLLPDHDAGVLSFSTCEDNLTSVEDQYTNKISEDMASPHLLMLTPCTWFDEMILAPFTRWDSAQFLDIAARMGDTGAGLGHVWDGYSTEASHAFLPLFPLIINFLARFLIERIFPALSLAQACVVAGVIISNVCFIVAAMGVYHLTNIVGPQYSTSVSMKDKESTNSDTERAAKVSALAFCLAPAGNVFFSMVRVDIELSRCILAMDDWQKHLLHSIMLLVLTAFLCISIVTWWFVAKPYTESLFAALTFWGIYLFLGGCPWQTTDLETRHKVWWKHLLRRISGLFFLSISSLVRSNGIVNGGYPLYFGIISIFFVMIKSRDFINSDDGFNTDVQGHQHKKEVVTSKSLKYTPEKNKFFMSNIPRRRTPYSKKKNTVQTSRTSLPTTPQLLRSWQRQNEIDLLKNQQLADSKHSTIDSIDDNNRVTRNSTLRNQAVNCLSLFTLIGAICETISVVMPFYLYLWYCDFKFCSSLSGVEKNGVIYDGSSLQCVMPSFCPCIDGKGHVFNTAVLSSSGQHFVDLTLCDCVVPNWCYSHNKESFLHSIGIASTDIYAYVQREHWNVGAFKYFQLKQIPNFLLSLPITLVVAYATYIFFGVIAPLGFKRIPRNYALLRTVGNRRVAYMILRILPFVLHALFITIFGAVVINVQVLTRLLGAGCVVVHWVVGDALSGILGTSAQILVVIWIITYNLFGPLLHCNFLPWT